MRADIEKRLAKLEQSTQQDQHRVTEIHLVSAETGEVGAVIYVGGDPDQKEGSSLNRDRP